MMTKNDGGRAFPVALPNASASGPMVQQMPGLSLRDYFAGQALAGLVASDNSNWGGCEDAAGWCYEMADAMLRAREGE